MGGNKQITNLILTDPFMYVVSGMDFDCGSTGAHVECGTCENSYAIFLFSL